MGLEEAGSSCLIPRKQVFCVLYATQCGVHALVIKVNQSKSSAESDYNIGWDIVLVSYYM